MTTIFIDSNVLLKCLRFTLRENASNRGRLWFVVLLYMSCISTKFPFDETTNAPMTHRLSTEPAIRLWALLHQGMVCTWYILEMRLIKILDKGIWSIMFFNKLYNVMILFKQNNFLCLLLLTRLCKCYKIPSLYFNLLVDSLIQTFLQQLWVH